MSFQKSIALLTFILILAADVLGFMANAGMGVSHVHATIGLLAALGGLLSVIFVFGGKEPKH